MKYEIYYNELLTDDKKVKGIKLVIKELYTKDKDIYSFDMDKGDVWNVWCIANTVFDKMILPE